MTIPQFQQKLQGVDKALEVNLEACCTANAQLLGSRIREHIVRDDLPLRALSQGWIAQKQAGGGRKNHLWWTGQYLANFAIEQLPNDGAVVGTRRPTDNPTFNLPEYLEREFPVWRLTLDECEPIFERNYNEAFNAAIEGRRPRFTNQ
jgi:hypothetical protein